MGYIDPAFIADEVTVTESILSSIAELIPGWEPSEGHIETAVAEAVGIAIATAFRVMREELINAYTGIGLVLGVPRLTAVASEALTNWVFLTNPGTIPGGTVVSVAGTEEPFDFVVAEDTLVTGLIAEGVPLVALSPGIDGNGFSGAASTTELAGVSSITLVTESVGGQDEESLDDYVNRLADRATRLRALPVTVEDHAAFALDVGGVGRAFALNRYDASSGLNDAPGHVTVFAFTPEGPQVGAVVRQNLVDYFASIDKVLSTTVHVGTANQVAVTVAITVVAKQDADRSVLQAEIIQAVTDAFNLSVWDLDEDVPGLWSNPPTRVLTVYQVDRAITNLTGLQSVIDITINGALLVTLPEPLSVPVLSGTPTITIL